MIFSEYRSPLFGIMLSERRSSSEFYQIIFPGTDLASGKRAPIKLAVHGNAQGTWHMAQRTRANFTRSPSDLISRQRFGFRDPI
jgi:hypothetical protein